MDYETLRLLAGLLIGLCLAQSILLIVLFMQNDGIKDDALTLARVIEDIARGKAKAYMHLGRVHISDND